MRKFHRIIHPDQLEFNIRYLAPGSNGMNAAIEEGQTLVADVENADSPDMAILADEGIVMMEQENDDITFISLDTFETPTEVHEPWVAPARFKLPEVDSERLSANYLAIETIKKVEKENREATAKEKNILAAYTGWGGCDFSYYDRLPDGDDIPARGEIEAYPPALRSSFLRMVERNAPNGASALFANCDVPSLIGMAGEKFAKQSRIGFHSNDTVALDIAKALYPSARFYSGIFSQADIPDEYFQIGVIGQSANQNYITVEDRVKTMADVLRFDYSIQKGGIALMNFSHHRFSGAYPKAAAVHDELAEDLNYVVILEGKKTYASKKNRWGQMAAPKIDTHELIFATKRTGKDFDRSPFSTTPKGSKYSTDRWPGWVVDEEKKVDMTDVDGISLNVLRLPDTVFTTSYVMEPTHTGAEALPELKDIPAIPYGGYKILDDGTVVQNRDGCIRPLIFTSETEKSRLVELIQIQESGKKVFALRQEGGMDGDFLEAQKGLRTLCDNYIEKFYAIASESSLQYFIRSSDAGFLLGIERDYTAMQQGKADTIFNCPHQPLAHTGRPATIEEAYRRSLRMKGKVDINNIGEIAGLPEKDWEKIPNALGKLIYVDIENREYVPAEIYLSGDIVGKHEAAIQVASVDKSFQRNVEALEAVLPEPLHCDDVSLSRCAPWMDIEMIRQFSNSIFEKAGLIIDRFDGKWNVKVTNKNEKGKIRRTSTVDIYATNERNGTQILRMVLSGAPAEFNPSSINLPEDANGDPITGKALELFLKAKREEYSLVKTKFAAINETFKVWVNDDPKRVERVQRAYNRALNRYIPYTPTVSAVSLKGMNPAFKPDPHQIMAVAKGANMDSILLNHFTGAGKTFVLGGIANERIVRGQNSKIALVLPRATLTQFSAEMARLFPNLPVHIVGPKDITGESPSVSYQRAVKDTNCLTVFTYETFLDVPLGKKDQLTELAKQRKAAERNVALASTQAARKSAGKKLDALDKEIEKINNREMGMPVDITHAGFDGIMADEAHLLRNLKANGPGFEAANGNDRTADFFAKVEQLRARNPRMFLGFGTGTVGGRKASDIYNIMRYMAPEQLKSAGANTLGDFLNTFAVRDLMTKVDIKGEIQNYYGYELVPSKALSNLLNSFTDTVFEDDVERVKKVRPKYRNDGEQERITCPQSPDQQRIYNDILDAVMHKKGAKLTGDHILTLYQKAIRAAIDPRLVDKSAVAPDDGKIKQSVERAMKVYENSKDIRGTQLVFCDMYSRRPDPDDPADKGFNVYYEYRDELISRGIPKKEIAIINEVSDAKKDEIYDDFRAGKIRFLLGSRALIGTGMNIQDRISGDHYLDIPWNPEQQWQATGRARRPGNMNSLIDSFIFLTDRSPEAIVSSRGEAKIRATSAIFRLTARESSYQQVVSMIGSASELTAVIRGDDRYMAMSRLDTEIAMIRDSMGAAEHSNLMSRRNMYQLRCELQHAKIEIEEALPTTTVIDAAEHSGILLETDNYSGGLDGNGAKEFEDLLGMGPNKKPFKIFGFDTELAPAPAGGAPLMRIQIIPGNSSIGHCLVFDTDGYKTTQGMFTGLRSRMRGYKARQEAAESRHKGSESKLRILETGANMAGMSGDRLFEIVQSRDAIEKHINERPDDVWKRDAGEHYTVDSIINKVNMAMPKTGGKNDMFSTAVSDSVASLLSSHGEAIRWESHSWAGREKATGVCETATSALDYAKSVVAGGGRDEENTDFSGWSMTDFTVFAERCEKLVELGKTAKDNGRIVDIDEAKKICNDGILTVSMAVAQHEAERAARLNEEALSATLIGPSIDGSEKTTEANKTQKTV